MMLHSDDVSSWRTFVIHPHGFEVLERIWTRTLGLRRSFVLKREQPREFPHGDLSMKDSPLWDHPCGILHRGYTMGGFSNGDHTIGLGIYSTIYIYIYIERERERPRTKPICKQHVFRLTWELMQDVPTFFGSLGFTNSWISDKSKITHHFKRLCFSNF